MTLTNRTFGRWWVVVGAVLIQLALGAIYAWSVFTGALTDAHGAYRFSASQTAWIFSAGLATFAVVMIAAGKLQARIGPMWVAVAGGVTLGLGYVLGGLLGAGFWTQLLFIGVMGGAGVGLAYVVPIAVGVRWFPDKKGLISGLAVAGFGFGAVIWVKLAGSWFGGLLNTVSIFGLPGVQSVFIVYGVAFLTLVVLGSLTMVNPPDDYTPRGWSPPAADAAADGRFDYGPRQMLRSPRFYLLWSVFVCSALAGLMVIYCIKLFGIDILRGRGVAELGAVTGTAMAWYAVFNGLGRILWGGLSDHLGRKTAIVLMTGCQGLVMLLIYHGFIYVGAVHGFILAAALIGFNFGGNFALFPAAIADLFGNKNVGANYGWLFTAYGVAGIAGPLLAGMFKDAAAGAAEAGIWMTPFVIAGAACLLGSLLMALMPQNPAVRGAQPADEVSRVKLAAAMD